MIGHTLTGLIGIVFHYIFERQVRGLICIFLFSFVIQMGTAAENDYGIVKAWCNNEPATVENLDIKIGEEINIKIEIISKIDGFVDFQIYEPGVTKSFDIISGPSKFDEWISEYNVEPGWKKEYTWIVSPNDEWTNGRVPINVLVNFNKEINDDLSIQFTIARLNILDEQYSGPAPTHADDPSPTDQPPAESSPGFGVLAALIGVVAVVLATKRG